MTVQEAKHKLDFMKKAYQKLIDEKVDSGKLVGDGVRGEWRAETSLDEAYESMIEALDMAIKALEQQPCEDCISREAVEKITWEEPSYADGLNVLTEVRDKIRQLPSVTPKQKVGKWEELPNGYECSECGILRAKGRTGKYNYCPNCGAKMEVDNEK